MLDYTTTAEVADAAPAGLITDEVTPDLGRMVRHASNLIRRHTRHATYATNNDHMPTSPTIRQTFRDATIAQVITWLENDLIDDILSGGVTTESTLASTSSNGKSLSFDNSAADAAKTHLVGGGLGAEAAMILDGMGLLGGLPGVLR